MMDYNGFLDVIDRMARLQSKANHFSLKTSVFRALFAMMADTDIDIDYFTDLINHNYPQFLELLNENNATKLLKSLVQFYNSQIMLKPQYSAKIISIADGVHGVVMTGANFNKRLFL